MGARRYRTASDAARRFAGRASVTVGGCQLGRRAGRAGARQGAVHQDPARPSGGPTPARPPGRVLRALKAGIGVMPSYAERMSEKDMLAVAQFVAHATGAAK